ncbi:MAG TPA: DUF4166 domain-containing protein, partial [Steroidobacteraceae bacterium]
PRPAEAQPSGSAAPATADRPTRREWHRPAGMHGLLGDVAWRRLPPAVRTRFGEPVLKVDYVGEFDVVRASIIGRVIAWACQAIGTPVVPRTGLRVPAIIHVGPVDRGASWLREYRWPDGSACRVHSTKVIGADGTLTEELPAGLRMPLTVYQRRGVLHFVSKGYYFEFKIPWPRANASIGPRLRIPLPLFLSPGTTHVEHADELNGWFRFTMTVTHPLFGEVFYQTGRFRAAGDPS